MSAYYNEFDPFAAAWLRALIKAGHIADGEVDERSILEVRPDDLREFTQCHFFAGIGVWSYALRCAGWPDSRPVWTGSCPCQPFSSAGKGDEFADERHLWPAFFRLIRECRPVACFGEQVASKDALAWLDHVSTDLEGAGYTFGAVDTCAAGFGAPHIRQRLYWCGVGLADATSEGAAGGQRIEGGARNARRIEPRCRRADGDVGHAASGGWGVLGNAAFPRDGGHPDRAEFAGVALGDAQLPRLEGFVGNGSDGNRPRWNGTHAAGSAAEAGQLDDRVAQGDASIAGREGEMDEPSNGREADGHRTPGDDRGAGAIDRVGLADAEGTELARAKSEARLAVGPGATNGFWANAEWIACRDGKARPTQSRPPEVVDGIADSLGFVRDGDRAFLSPLIQKTTNRVGRLRGYGNAITAPAAQAFIEAFLEVTDVPL